MKVTKSYLKQIIKEAIQKEMGLHKVDPEKLEEIKNLADDITGYFREKGKINSDLAQSCHFIYRKLHLGKDVDIAVELAKNVFETLSNPGKIPPDLQKRAHNLSEYLEYVMYGTEPMYNDD